MKERQNTRSKQTNTNGSTPGIFAGGALTQPVIPRTFALIAAIVLVTIALYMTRPATEPAAQGGSLNLISDESPQDDGGRPTVGSESSADFAESQPKSEAQQPKNTSSVTVNGQNVPVPEDGNLHKTITDGNSTTTIDLSNSGDGGNVTTTTNVTIESSSGTPTDND